MKVVTAAAGLVLVLASLAGMYVWFDALSASPQPPKGGGQARLFFDRPDIDATLRVFVRTSGTVTSIEYWIEVQHSMDPKDLRFWLVLTGAARTAEQYPSGEALSTRNGCWDSMWFVPTKLVATCATRRLAPGAIVASGEALEDSQVITGTLVRQDQQPAPYGIVSTLIRQPFATTAGKRTFFDLPGFGTSYVPPADRPRFPIGLGDSVRGYVPANLIVAVDYRSLESSERLDNVAPAPVASDKLVWVEADNSLVQAHGSIVDTVIEERGQRSLFIIGILAGAAVSMVPTLAMAVVAAIRERRRAAADGMEHRPPSDPDLPNSAGAHRQPPPRDHQPGTDALKARLARLRRTP